MANQIVNPNIDLIQYTDSSHTTIEVHPQGWTLEYPSKTWHQSVIQAWLDEGNSIISYSPSLSEVKTEKLAEARNAFISASETPVTSKGFTWAGGYDSASKLNNKALLLEHQTLSSGTIFDSSHEPHTFTVNEIKDIATNVAVAYESAFATYQGHKASILSCGNDIACINSITI